MENSYVLSEGEKKMKRRLITIGATLAFLFMALAERGLVRAETMEELSEKVKTQNALIQELIQKVKILERGGKSAAEENGDLGKLVRRVEVLEKVEAVSSSEPTEKGWVNSDMAGFLKDVQVNGYMDAAYGFNFNRPRSRKNSLRIFDVDDNSFTFNAAELVIQKPASEPGDVGFRADMVYGYGQSQITNSTGSFGDDEFDLHQAYISYVAPIGNGLTLDIGKWITHIGLEVIEGYDGYNDNYSRSFNFGLAIPFTHLGLRAAYPLRDDISLLAGIANGWDNVEDNNRSKLYFAQIGWAPLDKISFLLNYGGGKEQDDRESNWRNIFNVVTTVTPMEKLTLNFNYNYGTEEDVPE